MKRYDIVGLKHVIEHEQGNWVRYEDHKADVDWWFNMSRQALDQADDCLKHWKRLKRKADDNRTRAVAAGFVLFVQWNMFVVFVLKAWFG